MVKMKVLIPYDGSKNAENALLELQSADFGRQDEILILVTDIFLPESAEMFFKTQRERQLKLERSGTCSHVPARKLTEEKKMLTCEVRRRLSNDFPTWNISIGRLPGASLLSSEILAKAAVWNADLIILGATFEDASVAAIDGYRSEKWRVAAEANCPVRIALQRFASNFNSPGRTVVFSDDPPKPIEIIRPATRSRWNNGIKMVRSPEKSKKVPKITTGFRLNPVRRIRNAVAAPTTATVSF